MVNRRDKAAKFARWGVYFANKPQVQAWKGVLKSVVQRGYADIEFREVSKNKVELVWAKAVTIGSPARLCSLALELAPTMEVLGDPVGIVDEGPAVVHEAPPAKRQRPRRLNKKTRAFDANSANATGEAADDAGVAATPLAGSAVPLFLPAHLLSLKCENLVRRADYLDAIPQHGYEVNMESPWSFPEGNFATVYPGTARVLTATGLSSTSRPVTIKVFTPDWNFDGTGFEAAADEAMAEVRRHVALPPSSPRLVKLLDVQLFPGDGALDAARVGLIFESFDMDLGTFLKTRGFTAPGQRHVLRSVSEALAHLHGAGVLHTQLQSSKVVLRGAAVRAAVQDKESDSEEPMDVTYQLPSSFEVRSP